MLQLAHHHAFLPTFAGNAPVELLVDLGTSIESCAPWYPSKFGTADSNSPLHSRSALCQLIVMFGMNVHLLFSFYKH